MLIDLGVVASRKTILARGGVAAIVLVFALTACSSEAAPAPNTATDAAENVAFTACTSQTCSGQLDGFPYEISMPKKWNGTLLIYSADTLAVSPSGTTYTPTPEIAPGAAVKNPQVADALLAQGYALAGAATPTGGWQVDVQVAAAKKVRDQFVSAVGKPNRIYTWGESGGALASVMLAQGNDWVDGAAPLCGMFAGFNPNYDLALDAAYAVKMLLYPKMKLTGYASQAEAAATYRAAMAAVTSAAEDKYGEGGRKLSALAAAAAVPTKTATSAGGILSGNTVSVPENLAVILARSTVGRYAIEQQFGGNPSTNVGTNYAARVTIADKDKLDVYKKGAMLKYLKIIQDGPRVAADPAARDVAAKSGAVSGQVRVFTVALHTAFDAQAIVQNESVLASAAIKAGEEQIRLLKINVTSPPTSYPESGPVPFGAGHCNFTTQSVVGTIAIVNDLVRDQLYPTVSNTERLLGPDSGFDKTFQLQPWPAGPA